jgi:hypothetical protein
MMSVTEIRPMVAQNNLPLFNLVGAAVLLEDRLRLTSEESDQAGAAWLPSKQLAQGGFEATFQFQISTDGADGLAFVIQNASGSALGDSGGGMGYHWIANSLAVEFDTWENIPEDFPSQLGDPNDKVY